MTKKIGILTGGGDCPGLNAVVASIVKVGIPMGYEFIGFERGWEGVLDPPLYRELSLEDVRGISHLGGTFLRTTNKGRFAAKVGTGDHNAIPEEILQQAKRNLDTLGIEGLIVIGGDGTLSGARQLADFGVKVVGVPKSIDNDLDSTDKTFGFSSAVNIVVEALDRIHTTAASHDRTFVVECMGRNTGWIAIAAGLAGGANAILMPEFEFNIDELIDLMRNRRKNHLRATIILIAEGARVGNQAAYDANESAREVHYGGVSEELIRKIAERTGDEFEMRNVVLGHTQRGGNPNAEDRTLSKRYGIAAIHAYNDGQYNKMVSLRGGTVQTVSLAEATAKLKQVTTKHHEYEAARQLGIYMHQN